jgi:3-oxoadipate enol-lactonase
MTPVDVHVEVDGPAEAPALVLSGSLGSTLSAWDPQVAALRDRFRLIRYDHRGHGRSPVPPGPYRIEDLTGDVLALLDRLGVPRAHFCGLSMGGMVGMRLAATAPDRVDRLVLCGTSALLGPPEQWAQRAAAVRAGGTASIAATVVGRWLTPPFAAAHPELVERLQAMVAGIPDDGYAACCGAIEHMDLRPLLGQVRAPTLVIVGAADPATPPEHGARIVAGIPGARMVVLDGAAHLANAEQPDAVTGLLLDHLTGPAAVSAASPPAAAPAAGERA